MNVPTRDVFAVFGPAGTLVALGLAGAALALLVAAVNTWMRYQRTRERPPMAEENTVEASPAYRRYLVAAAWAGGSARDWDYSVRPVVGELVELAMAERGGEGPGDQGLAEPGQVLDQHVRPGQYGGHHQFEHRPLADHHPFDLVQHRHHPAGHAVGRHGGVGGAHLRGHVFST